MQTTLTILVVDDETSFATALAALLSRDGHQVDTAENGNAALRQIQARHYGPAGAFEQKPTVLIFSTGLASLMKGRSCYAASMKYVPLGITCL
jgi:DNA-binding response OmpR family regulator